MASLIVKPINLAEPGSYRERKRFLGLLKRLRATAGTRDADQVLSTLDEADEMVRARLRTDDGSPVEDALDKLSANQFDQLLSAIAFESGVGEASAVPSGTGTGGTERITRIG